MKKKGEAKKLSRKVKSHLRKILDADWDHVFAHYLENADETMLDAHGGLDLAKVVKDKTGNSTLPSLIVVKEWLDQQ